MVKLERWGLKNIVLVPSASSASLHHCITVCCWLLEKLAGSSTVLGRCDSGVLKVNDPVLDDPLCIRKLFFLICVEMIPGNAQIWLELGRTPCWSLYHLYSEPRVPNNAIMVAAPHEENLRCRLPLGSGGQSPSSVTYGDLKSG